MSNPNQDKVAHFTLPILPLNENNKLRTTGKKRQFFMVKVSDEVYYDIVNKEGGSKIGEIAIDDLNDIRKIPIYNTNNNNNNNNNNNAAAISINKYAKKKTKFEGKVNVKGNDRPFVFHKMDVDQLGSKPYVFSMSSLNTDLVLEGEIAGRLDLLPDPNQHVADVRPAIVGSMFEQKAATIVEKDVNKPMLNTENISKAVAKINKEDKLRKEQQQMNRKVAEEDKEVVRHKIYSLFEIHGYWNAQEMAKRIEQPLTTVQEILKDICVYKKEGYFKHKWEMKEELKTQAHIKACKADDEAGRLDQQRRDDFMREREKNNKEASDLSLKKKSS